MSCSSTNKSTRFCCFSISFEKFASWNIFDKSVNLFTLGSFQHPKIFWIVSHMFSTFCTFCHLISKMPLKSEENQFCPIQQQENDPLLFHHNMIFEQTAPKPDRTTRVMSAVLQIDTNQLMVNCCGRKTVQNVPFVAPKRYIFIPGLPIWHPTQSLTIVI